jgi:GDPmannose 4,6-dehydratase
MDKIRRAISMNNKRKKALITGVSGQDGSYLAEFLLSKGYEVHGLIRRASSFNTKRIDHIIVDHHDPNARFFFYYGDLSDSEQISNILFKVQPDEVYHLGAQSHVRVSFDMPEYTGNVTALSTTRILEAIRRSETASRFYQASSSEIFGNSPPPQNEQTTLRPRSPYACAKVYSHLMTINYREGYNLWSCNGILFNHESPRRGETFVTRKITRGIASLLAHQQSLLYLGNLENKRDWGYAPEYVEMMWRMLQNDIPEDFVIGVGEAHSVKDFLEEAFSYAGLDWDKYVRIDPMYFRPTEPETLVADARKATQKLLWNPQIRFKDLVRIMVDADMRLIGLKPFGEGDKVLKKFKNRWWKID